MHEPTTPFLTPRRRLLALAATTALAAAVALPSAPSAGQAGDPPGNNGTVKIDGVEFDDAPNNEPHPGCTFQVDFYGFDAEVGDATVTFELQAPTADGRTLDVVSGDLTPDIGEDAAGGGTDLDASETYELAFTGEPHPQQGYHVKLTVNAPGSIGADTKHKVFWVEDCGDELPATTTTIPDGTTTTTVPDGPTTTVPDGSTTTLPDGTTTVPGGVLGGSAQPGGARGGAQGGQVLSGGANAAPVAPASSAAPLAAQADYTG
ncbi:MAG TPA: hypothetical protein VHK88_15455 [Aquihabitans sp.]|jgi:hypothetical protein|nr:hypothetical protein [Aquihabitans sp.]